MVKRNASDQPRETEDAGTSKRSKEREKRMNKYRSTKIWTTAETNNILILLLLLLIIIIIK